MQTFVHGLSLATVVTEAPLRSGALITAHRAADFGRDVFAVPGRANDPGCAGSNRLLKEGAGLVTCPWDILEPQVFRYPCLKQPSSPLRENPVGEISVPRQAPKAIPKTNTAPERKEVPPQIPTDLSPEEQKVLSCLGPESRHLDTVAVETGLNPSAVLSALTMLEIKGVITTQPGGWAKTGNNH